MLIEFPDRGVVVTGAGHGFGRAIAHGFARRGARVWCCDLDQAKIAETASLAGAKHPIQGRVVDVSGRDGVRAFVAEAERACGGRIDVLVNNAGNVFGRRPFVECDETFVDEILQLNVRSVVTLCRAIVPVFRRQGGGNIINVTSIAARNGGGPGVALYAATKGFVSTLTRGLAKELVGDKVRVNGIFSGMRRRT